MVAFDNQPCGAVSRASHQRASQFEAGYIACDEESALDDATLEMTTTDEETKARPDFDTNRFRNARDIDAFDEAIDNNDHQSAPVDEILRRNDHPSQCVSRLGVGLLDRPRKCIDLCDAN